MLQTLSAEKETPDFESQMDARTRAVFESFKHLRVEAAFDDRYFYLFRHGADNKPDILTQIRVVDFECVSKEGSSILIEDMNTGEKMTLDHVPRLVFGYPVFMYAATVAAVQFTLRKGVRSLTYPIMIKTRYRASTEFPGASTVYVETQKRLMDLYPGVRIPL